VRSESLVLSAMLGSCLLACASSPGLSSLRSPRMHVEISQEGRRELRLMVTSETAAAAPTGRCTRMAPSSSATLNGQLLERLTGPYAGGDLAYDRDCLLEFRFREQSSGDTQVAPYEGDRPSRPHETKPRVAGSEGLAVLSVEDGQTQWSLTIPEAFTRRRLELLSPEGGRVHRGQPLTLRWSPATDGISEIGTGIVLRSRNHTERSDLLVKQMVVRNNTIQFIIPADLPEDWDGSLAVEFVGTALVHPAIDRCPVTACSISMRFSVEAVIVVLSPSAPQ
jgi:hypothetical protein